LRLAVLKSENLYLNMVNAVMRDMRPPCEIVVTKVLPAIRAVLVKDLRDRHDLSQKEIAEKLGVTQAAVSQYLSSARGDEKVEGELRNFKSYDEIRDLADRIATEDIKRPQITKEYCKICELMRGSGMLCTIHTENSKLGKECDTCLDVSEDES